MEQIKVKLKTTMAGPSGTHAAGSIISVSEVEARELISGGFAEHVEAPAVEKRAGEPVETASLEPVKQVSSAETSEAEQQIAANLLKREEEKNAEVQKAGEAK